MNGTLASRLAAHRRRYDLKGDQKMRDEFLALENHARELESEVLKLRVRVEKAIKDSIKSDTERVRANDLLSSWLSVGGDTNELSYVTTAHLCAAGLMENSQ